MPDNEFPFTADYPSSALEIPMATTVCRAERVVESIGFDNAENLLRPEGGATLEGHGELLLDFGRELVGWLGLELESDAAAKLRLTYGEHADEARRGEPSRVHFYTLQEDIFETTGGACEFRSHGRRAFRYLKLSAESAGRLSIKDLRISHRHAAVPRQGAFTCSDERLNKIWNICRYTTLLCMQNYYEDGIKRDGLLWIGDYRVQYLCNLGCFGDQRLARKSLAMIAASQRTDGAVPACAGIGGGKQHPDVIDCMPGIPKWPERWILLNYMTDFISAVAEFALHSGEDIAEFIPAVARAADYLVAWDDFSPETLKNHFISDDSLTPPDGQKPYRPAAALPVHLYWGLDTAAALIANSSPQLAARCRARCRELRAMLHQRFTRPDGLFRDFADKDFAGWHANAVAVLAGMVDEPRRHLEALLACPDALKSEGGFLRFWTLDALFANGFHEAALDSIRSAWGKILDVGLGTCPEAVREDPSTYFAARSPLSLCHGWSAGPAWLLPRHILGARPVEPGWRAVRIRPRLAGLEYAECAIPTPMGMLAIRAEAKGADGAETAASVALDGTSLGAFTFRPEDGEIELKLKESESC